MLIIHIILEEKMSEKVTLMKIVFPSLIFENSLFEWMNIWKMCSFRVDSFCELLSKFEKRIIEIFYLLTYIMITNSNESFVFKKFATIRSYIQTVYLEREREIIYTHQLKDDSMKFAHDSFT